MSERILISLAIVSFGIIISLYRELVAYIDAIAIGFTGIVAIGGYIFNDKQKREEEIRNMKKSYLEKAYIDISIYSGRKQAIKNGTPCEDKNIFLNFERATKSIMLYGSKDDNELLSKIMKDIKEKNTYDFDPLLSNLKKSLRAQGGLEPYDGPNFWLIDNDFFKKKDNEK